MTDIPVDPGQPGDYDARYYARGCGPAYGPDQEHWQTFFGAIARHLVHTLGPATALDAGCAMGILVGALRELGVDAEGVDVSPYAVDHADPRARGHLRVADLAQPLGRRYDLVVCIEVLEHIDAAHSEAVVANLAAATDLLLLSSTPEDFAEASHVNVRPPAYWAGLFADHGLHRRFDVDASVVSPWAVLLERDGRDRRQLVSQYEGALWELRRENRGTRSAVLARERELGDALEAERRAAAERDALRAELAAAQSALLGQRARAERAEADLVPARVQRDQAQARAAQVVDSPAYRVGGRLVRVLQLAGRPRRAAAAVRRRWPR